MPVPAEKPGIVIQCAWIRVSVPAGLAAPERDEPGVKEPQIFCVHSFEERKSNSSYLSQLCSIQKISTKTAKLGMEIQHPDVGAQQPSPRLFFSIPSGMEAGSALCEAGSMPGLQLGSGSCPCDTGVTLCPSANGTHDSW